MLTNLLIFQILIPFSGSLLSFILPKRITWLFTTFVMLVTLLISVMIFKLSLAGESLSYQLGNWSSSIGIEYKLDKLNAFFIMLVSTMSMLNIISMKNILKKEIDETKISLFLGLFLLAIVGLLGVSISNDIFNIYVLLEVNSIASYALVGATKKQGAKRAALEYLIFGTIGSTFILFGIGFIYALCGSLNLTEIALQIPTMLDNMACITGIALLFLGFLMKASLFPLSNWLVNTYQYSSSSISAMLASISNKIGIYLILRFYFFVFKLNNSYFDYLEIILLILAIIAIFSCAILALKQTNIKRFLAYSSLSQIGFIILSVALASELSISGALIYSFTHALEKTCLFLSIGYLIINATSSEEMSSFSGLIKDNLLISIIIIINLMSSVGIPLTAGFVGKWQIFKAALASDIWYILIVSVAMLFTFSYVFRFVELLILHKQDQEREKIYKIDPCIIIISLATLINLYIGIDHQFLLDIAAQIAKIAIK